MIHTLAGAAGGWFIRTRDRCPGGPSGKGTNRTISVAVSPSQTGRRSLPAQCIQRGICHTDGIS